MKYMVQAGEDQKDIVVEGEFDTREEAEAKAMEIVKFLYEDLDPDFKHYVWEDNAYQTLDAWNAWWRDQGETAMLVQVIPREMRANLQA